MRRSRRCGCRQRWRRWRCWWLRWSLLFCDCGGSVMRQHGRWVRDWRGFLGAAHIALARFGPYLSSKQLAQEIAARARPQDKVMIYGDQAYGSSLLFYLRRPIELVEGRTTSMWFGSTFADAPKIYLSNADLRQEWAARGRIFLLVPPHQITKVDQVLPEKVVIAAVSGENGFRQQTWNSGPAGGSS